MGRKKRGVEVLSPFCHYCDKEFETEKDDLINLAYGALPRKPL